METRNKTRRLDRRDYIIILALGAAVAAAVFGFTHFKYVFGAELDWADQHFAIPDYFRKLFYETGELFPSFAPNLGAGENIYYLSYYGLFSPVILLSYLMPFVSMVTYIQISSAVLCWLGTALFYRFMRKRCGHRLSLLIAVAYLTATPVFFQAHRHIMFVSYLPFVILALEAVDSFFENGKKWPLVLWTFLVILTNWFFSFSAVTAITVYGVYKYLSVSEKFVFKDFAKAAGSFALRIVCAVMLAGILLLPTVNVLLSGRDESNSGISLTDLIPQVSTEAISYSPYSMGLGAFAVLAVVCAVIAKGNKARRFLGIVFTVICCFPALTYILNGTMYLECKVFIPFIPLALILCADLLEDLKEKRLPVRAVIIYAAVIALSTVFAVMHINERYTFIAKLGMLIDSAILAAMIALHYIKGWKMPFVISMLALPVIIFIPVNNVDELIPKEKLEARLSPSYETLSRKACDSDENLWRSAIADQRVDTVNLVPETGFYGSYIYSSLHHKGYNDFYFKVMQNENEFRNSALTTRSQNPFFTAFMGERYLISRSEEPPYGYEAAGSDGGLYLYVSKNVLPVGRTARTLGEDVFEKLGSAEKMEALNKYIVTGSGGSYESSVQYLGTVKLPDDGRIIKTADGWRITSEKKMTVSAPLGYEVPEGKLLVLEMTCDNTVGIREDARVTINGVRNALTAPDWKYYNNNSLFTYALAPCEQLEYIFTAGDFALGELHAWLVDEPAFDGDALIIDKESTGGDVIKGSITCREDTFFELAVPYDKGFKITVDGKEQEYECVDSSFIGFPISAGEHTIEAVYTAPLRREGMLMSAAGLGLYAVLIALEIIGKKRER